MNKCARPGFKCNLSSAVVFWSAGFVKYWFFSRFLGFFCSFEGRFEADLSLIKTDEIWLFETIVVC